MTTPSGDSQETAPGPDRAPASAPVLDATISGVLMLVGLLVAADGVRKGLDLDVRTMPGVAPLAFGLFLALPSSVMFVRSLREWVLSRGHRQRPSWAETRYLVLPVSVLLGLALYAVALPTVGYLLSSFIFSIAVLWGLQWRGLKGLVAAVGLTAGVYLLFLVALEVPLPSGILG